MFPENPALRSVSLSPGTCLFEVFETRIMKSARAISIAFACLAANIVAAQRDGHEDLISGTWKGTSLCQVKNSPCHDERVVYHTTKSAGSDSFYILMNKMVNGAEEEMGTLPCGYDANRNILRCTAYGSLWIFEVKGKKMLGTLTWKNSLYRKIDVAKQ
jgi:hypothetical protein